MEPIKAVRRRLPECQIRRGNVGTYEAAKDLHRFGSTA